MLRGLLNGFIIGEYDWFKYRILELSTGSHDVNEGGRE